MAGASVEAAAADYRCLVAQKFNSLHQYTRQELAEGQLSVLIEERSDAVYVSGCSYVPSAQRVTCDLYQIDQMFLDRNISVRKYRLFRSQFDLRYSVTLFGEEQRSR